MASKEEIILNLAKQFPDPSQFIQYMENAFSSYTESQNAKSFEDIGEILVRFSFFKHALFVFDYALKYYINTSNNAHSATCYTYLGIAYLNLGNFKIAIDYTEKGLAIGKEIRNKDVEGSCYTTLGSAYQRLGDLRKAIDYTEKGIGIAKEIGNKYGEGSCYGNLGIDYFILGNYSKAIEYHEKSLCIAKEIGNKRGRGSCYTNLGNAYERLGEFKKAIEYHEKGLGIAKEIGNKSSECSCYTNLGIVYERLGEFKKAIECHQKSLEIAIEIGDRQSEGLCYTNLGNSYQSLGDFRMGISYQEKWLNISKEIGDKQGEGSCYGNLGIYHYLLQDYSKASSSLQKSIEITEKIGSDLMKEEHKIGYYGLQVNIYTMAINSFIKTKNIEKAFEYLEKSKSKTFNDILSMTSHLRPSIKNVSKEYQILLDKEEELIAKLRTIQIQNSRLQQQSIGVMNITSHNTITSTSDSSIQHNQLESDNILNELSLVHDKIEKEFDPEYVFVRRSKSFPVSKIQDFLKSIKKDKNKNVIIVEYYYTGDIDNKIYIFVVNSDHIDIQPVDMKDVNLDNKIDLYLKEIYSAPPSSTTNVDNNITEYLEHSQKLSKYLIEPISFYISNADLIYFVPFGKLHYIPLHALLLDNKPLIVDHAVTYIPSASLLRFVKNKGTGTLENCLSCGIVFKEEAKEIANIFSSNSGSSSTSSSNSSFGSIYLEEPTKKEFIDKLTSNNTFDILHLSCHGFFNDQDPMASSLLFPDAFLRAKEILDLQINTELVTLSACETGRNENKLGDELVGLTRSFLYAGAPSVLVSLWKVHSETTRDIMIEFYKQLKKEDSKIDLATALQTAQKNIMQKSEYKHPYLWAPFVLVGDWE